MARPKVKIVVTTLMWKRPEIFRTWATALKAAAGENMPAVLVAGSEGTTSRVLAEEYGFHYIEVPNRPIGRKANARFTACRALDPDYVIFCGSDDIVSAPTWRYYEDLAARGAEEVNIDDIYHYNSHTGELAYSPGYKDHRSAQPVAPWRMLSRKLCEALGWRGWTDDERLFLDRHFYDRLEAIPHAVHRIHVRDQGLFVCDIKSQVNMTRWRTRSHWQVLNPALLERHLTSDVLVQLAKLRGPVTDTRYLGVRHLKEA
ncbi:hypothetical protein LCGC14_1112790 [marine sediment metagenome]|uniref:Glycosyltransferase 2-like domain-containing protein n=1 Tax=marine sediment metagenome TaxID=412755 RepID=A0A0F9PPD3_9ZZZZ